jgi:hypothetical protein
MSGKNKKVRKVRKTLSMTISGQPTAFAPKARLGPNRHVSFKKFHQSHSQGVNLASPAQQMMRPMSMRTIKGRSSTRCLGTDFLTSITIGGTNAAAGDVLYTTVVNPTSLGVGRLATIAKLYERYKFRSLKFRYAPVANAQVSGQLLGYVDYDTQDDPTGISGVQNLQRAGAHLGEKPVQVWQGSEKPVFWEIKDEDPLTDLYCDSDGTDPRWTNQGRFVLIAASAIASGTACGNIYLDYDLELFIPQLELSPTTGYGYKQTGGGTITTSAPLGDVRAVEGWSNLPITSTTSVLTIPAGCYYFTVLYVGTTLTAGNAAVGSTGTSITSNTFTGSNTAATLWSVSKQVYASSSWTITCSCSAATITSSIFTIGLLPSGSTTLTLKRQAALNRMVREVGEMSKYIDDAKERKETESQVRVMCDSKPAQQSSTSSMTSSAMHSVSSANLADILSGKAKVDEGYCLVRKS